MRGRNEEDFAKLGNQVEDVGDDAEENVLHHDDNDDEWRYVGA
jgi:hypothetical protein